MVVTPYSKGGILKLNSQDNPGPLSSAVPVEQFGKKSFSRNPLVFGLLTRLGLVEQVGPGIGRMRKAMEGYGLPGPTFNLKGMFDVTFYRPVDFEKWLDHLSSLLNPTQIKILELINENNKITATLLAKAIGISVTAVENNIRKLRELRLLERYGSNKAGQWKIIHNPPRGIR